MSGILALLLFVPPMATLVYFMTRAQLRAIEASALPTDQRSALRHQAIALAVQGLAIIPVILLAMTPLAFRAAVFPFTPLLILPTAYMALSSFQHGVALGGRPFVTGQVARIGGAITLMIIAVGSALIVRLALEAPQP